MNIPVRRDMSSANLSIILIFPLLGWHHLYRDRLPVFSCSEKVAHRSLEAAILSWHLRTWTSEGVPRFPNRWRQLTMFRLFVQMKWFILNNCFPCGSRGFWYMLGEGAPVKMGANSQVSRGIIRKSLWGLLCLDRKWWHIFLERGGPSRPGSYRPMFEMMIRLAY